MKRWRFTERRFRLQNLGAQLGASRMSCQSPANRQTCIPPCSKHTRRYLILLTPSYFSWEIQADWSRQHSLKGSRRGSGTAASYILVQALITFRRIILKLSVPTLNNARRLPGSTSTCSASMTSRTRSYETASEFDLQNWWAKWGAILGVAQSPKIQSIKGDKRNGHVAFGTFVGI